MIVPGKKVLVEVLPNEQKPGIVMHNRAELPSRGRVIALGHKITEEETYINGNPTGVKFTTSLIRKGDVVHFRYHFGFSIQGTSPELMVIEYDNIELIERGE